MVCVIVILIITIMITGKPRVRTTRNSRMAAETLEELKPKPKQKRKSREKLPEDGEEIPEAEPSVSTADSGYAAMSKTPGKWVFIFANISFLLFNCRYSVKKKQRRRKRVETFEFGDSGGEEEPAPSKKSRKKAEKVEKVVEPTVSDDALAQEFLEV
jgi:hypothetical protein